MIHTGHYIEIPIKNSDISHIFTNFPTQIWLVYLVSILFLLSTFSIKLIFRGVKWNHVPGDLIVCFGLFCRQNLHVNFRLNQISPYLMLNSLISIFVLNFIFETLIKTDKVLIDTSGVINSIDDALRSDRVLGWGVEERVNLEFSEALPGSWQHKIWSKKKFWVQKTIYEMRNLLKFMRKLLAIQDMMYLYVFCP